MRSGVAFALLFLMIFSSAWAGGLEVAPPGGNWNKVQSVPQGARLMLEFAHGGEIEGDFVRLNEAAILMKIFDTERVYPRDSVKRVKLMRPGSRARNAAIIGGIFFGIGFGFGYAVAAKAADQDSMASGERGVMGAAVGAAWGGVAAAITAARRPGPRAEVIYRAK